MHTVSGLSLRFTGRKTWTAEVFKGSRLVATVPVAWRDNIIFDRVMKRPKEFLVALTSKEKALKWMKDGESIIAVAAAKDISKNTRDFKEFVKLYRLKPIDVSSDPLVIRASYIELVTDKSFD